VPELEETSTSKPASEGTRKSTLPEPVRMRDFPLSEGVPDPYRDPYDSNQAIPTLLVTRDRKEFEAYLKKQAEKNADKPAGENQPAKKVEKK